jgi:hypothetical protein
VPCNVANALYVRDRRAAKFHHKTGHRVEIASFRGAILNSEINGPATAWPRA